MAIAILKTRACFGINSPLVQAEVHISRGLPRLNIVGLADTAAKESKDRVRSAILSSGYDFPLQRITINLSPAEIPKLGSHYDLAIAIGILLASGQLKADCNAYEFIGELSLSGEILKSNNILMMLLQASKSQHKLIIPQANNIEGGWIENSSIYSAANIQQVIQHLQNTNLLTVCQRRAIVSNNNSVDDFAEVQGQPLAKRVIEIAAAGGHHMLMIGAPGIGKSMLAARMPSIMPALSLPQAQMIAAIYMQHGQDFQLANWRQVPFRSPHHSISNIALLGGGQVPMPGEISLAHHGILFLDEWPEFPRSCCEALREPLSSGIINIARASYRITFPAQFQLIAAMNPCPCGYWQDGSDRCNCSIEQIKKYMMRISGPLLDRIDLKLRMSAPSTKILIQAAPQESSQCIKSRVCAARQLQSSRSNVLNAQLPANILAKLLGSRQIKYLQHWAEQQDLSMRSVHKIIKISRTIADLAGSETITQTHVEEACAYNN